MLGIGPGTDPPCIEGSSRTYAPAVKMVIILSHADIDIDTAR